MIKTKAMVYSIIASICLLMLYVASPMSSAYIANCVDTDESGMTIICYGMSPSVCLSYEVTGGTIVCKGTKIVEFNIDDPE